MSNLKIRYIQLKPSPETVLKKLPWTGAKRPYLLITYTDGTTKTVTVRNVDLRRDPHQAIKIAVRMLRDAENDAALGRFDLRHYSSKAEIITVGKFFSEYLGIRQRAASLGDISKKTLSADGDAIKVFLMIVPHKTPMSHIIPDTISKWIDDLRRTRTRRGSFYTSKSINTYMGHLSSAFTFAAERNYIDENPFFKVSQLPVEKSHRYLTDEEVTLLRNNLTKEWQVDFFEVAIKTGLRISEILDLNVQRYKVERIDGVSHPYYKVFGKGSKWRWVPVGDCIDILEKRRRRIEESDDLYDYLFDRSPQHIEKHMERARQGYVFFDISRIDTAEKAFKKIRRRLKMDEDITPHSFRHTFAVRFLEEERGDIYALSRILGHESVSTTEIYLFATPKLLRLRPAKK